VYGENIHHIPTDNETILILRLASIQYQVRTTTTKSPALTPMLPRFWEDERYVFFSTRGYQTSAFPNTLRRQLSSNYSIGKWHRIVILHRTSPRPVTPQLTSILVSSRAQFERRYHPSPLNNSPEILTSSYVSSHRQTDSRES
jgi:hypothetical protein